MQKHFDKRLRLNNQIREPQIQVIDADGRQLGVIPTHEALRIANEHGLDLVEVGPSAKPPIAKIMDFGKYMYQKEKKERGSRTSKSETHEIKTVKIGFKTEMHDLAVRLEQINKFLRKGHRVRVELTLRGRERQMSAFGRQKLENFAKTIAEPYTLDESIKSFPGGLGMLIRPETKHK